MLFGIPLILLFQINCQAQLAIGNFPIWKWLTENNRADRYFIESRGSAGRTGMNRNRAKGQAWRMGTGNRGKNQRKMKHQQSASKIPFLAGSNEWSIRNKYNIF